MSDVQVDAKAIFLEALDCADSVELHRFLDRACGSEQPLRARVEELLRANEDAANFLGGREPPEATGDVAFTERPGTTIGPYKLLEQIGEGGMGVVFLAEQTEPVRRNVALKIIKPGMETKQVVARFEAERQALALMDHPNIARVLDAGATDSGRPFFVMELVRGIPITEYCDQCRLTTRERLELFITVCRAVQHAHQKGIIHRDIKPSNVLLAMQDGKPTPKIIDFGVVKAINQRLTERTLLTGFAQMIGTPLYVSPEQAEMSPLDVDTRTDVYSLGVLLYELLTGTTPLSKDQVNELSYDDLRRVIREEEPPRPSTRLSTLRDQATKVADMQRTELSKLGLTIRGDLDWIVMKALEKDRMRRYETANGLARDLERFLSDEPVEARPPSTWYRLGKFARRNKGFITAAATIVAVLLVGTVVSTTMALRNAQLAREKGNALDVVHRQKDEIEGTLHREKLRLFEARLAEARASRFSRRVGQRYDSLRALGEAAQLARELRLAPERFHNLRNEAIAAFALVDVGRPKPWPDWPTEWRMGLAIDNNFERYARGDDKGNVSVRRVADDREVVRLPGDGPGGNSSGAASIRFSPDGRLLAVVYLHQIPDRDTNFRLWDWQRRRVVLEPRLAVHKSAFAFSGDGRHLALGQADGTITIYNANTGDVHQHLSKGVRPRNLAFDPSGIKLAVAGTQRADVRDVASGKLIRQLSTPDILNGVAWHPNGALLAGASDDGMVCLWDTATGEELKSLEGHLGSVVRVAFAPDGTLLSWAWDGSCRFWNPWTRSEMLRVDGNNPFLSETGRWLVIHGGYAPTTWEWNPGLECRTLPKREGVREHGLGHGGFSRDGRWLAMAGSEGVRLWDTATCKEAAFLPLGRSLSAKFHPKENVLITSTDKGLFFWPLQSEDGVIRIGRVRRMPLSGKPRDFSIDRQGRMLAVEVPGRSNRILDLAKPSAKGLAFHHHNANSIAICPDGRWLAAGAQEGPGIKVWDAKSGEVKRHFLPKDRYCRVAFSSDARWLVASATEAHHVWECSSWRLVRTIPREPVAATSAPAFTADGRLMAVCPTLATIELIGPATGQVLAVLEAPNSDRIRRMVFSPDGSQLAVATYADVVQLWDLRRIRAQLKKMGLDWNHRTYPPPNEATDVRVEVDVTTYDQLMQAQQEVNRGRDSAKSEKWKEAEAALSEALRLDPSLFEAYCFRGQVRLRLGKPRQAVDDLTRALDQDQGFWQLWTWRADARAELELWDEANEDLARAASLASEPGCVEYRQAIVHLARQDFKGYQQACAKMVSRAEKSQTSSAALWAAWTSVLSPDSESPPARIVALAEKALAKHPKNSEHLTLLGAALFRAGRFKKAVERLTEAEKASSTNPLIQFSRAYGWLFRAMAHARFKQMKEAQQCLSKGLEVIAASSKTSTDPWNRRLTFQILRQEAESTLKQ